MNLTFWLNWTFVQKKVIGPVLIAFLRGEYGLLSILSIITTSFKSRLLQAPSIIYHKLELQMIFCYLLHRLLQKGGKG